MRGIHLNDVPLDIFLKYFNSDDLQDRLLEPKLIDDERDYYEYTVTVSGEGDFTVYSHLTKDGNDADELVRQAFLELAPIIAGLEESDITLAGISAPVSTVSLGMMYVSQFRPGAIYPIRYSFEYAIDGETIHFIAVDGSIDEISDVTSIEITDTRTGDNAIGSGVYVNLVLNSAESRYYVYDSSSSLLLGYVYENTESKRQKLDSLSRPVFIDESGNETSMGFRGSRMLRHSSALRSSFFSGGSLFDPRELSFPAFLPGVVGLYKQGTEAELIYHEKFLRSKSYEQITLTTESYSDVAITQEIKDGLDAGSGSYGPVVSEESRLRTLLDLSSVRRVAARFSDEPSFTFSIGSEVASNIDDGDPIIVVAEKGEVSYDNVLYETSSSNGIDTISVGSQNLEIGYSEESGRNFVKIPVKKELDPANTLYYQKKILTAPERGYFYDYTTSSSKIVLEILSTKNESDVFVVGTSITGYFATLILKNKVTIKTITAGTMIFITSSNQLKKLKSDSSGLESASIPSNNLVFSRSDQAFNGAKGDTLYTYSSGSWTASNPSMVRTSSIELYREYVTVSDKRYDLAQDAFGKISPVRIKEISYPIQTGSSNPIYSLGYIEYPVFVTDRKIGVEYFGQVASSGDRTFTLVKYSPTYEDTGVTMEDFDLDGYVYNSGDGSYTKTYYIRDYVDRSLAVEVTETISKSGDNADGSSTPNWTDFIDYNHTYTVSGVETAIDLNSGKKCFRSGAAITSPSTLERMYSRFTEFDHSLVDGTFRISTRGDLIPSNTVRLKRSQTLGRMGADFLNRPTSDLFTVSNVGNDENAPMKMRIYSEAVLSMVSSSPRRRTTSGKPQSSSISEGTTMFQRIDRSPTAGLSPAVYGDGYFSEEISRASASVSSSSGYQKLLSYSQFPTNESRVRSEFASLARSKIMSSHTSTESAKDDVVGYDRTTRERPNSRISLAGGISESLVEFFFSSNTYSDRDFSVNNYYKYYKDKLDAIPLPVYPEESEQGSYKITALRSRLASEPGSAYIVEKILSRFDESGSEEEWRVL